MVFINILINNLLKKKKKTFRALPSNVITLKWRNIWLKCRDKNCIGSQLLLALQVTSYKIYILRFNWYILHVFLCTKDNWVICSTRLQRFNNIFLVYRYLQRYYWYFIFINERNQSIEYSLLLCYFKKKKNNYSAGHLLVKTSKVSF